MHNKRIIHTVFDARCEQYPDNIALESGDASVTYGELKVRVDDLVRMLGQYEHQVDDVVGVALPPGVEAVTAMMACFKAGKIYLPIDLKHAEQKVLQIVDQTRPRILIHSLESEATIRALKDKIPGVFEFSIVYDRKDQRWECTKGTESFDKTKLSIENEDSNYIFYTSGTTGTAKGVVGKQESLSHFIHWEISEFAVSNSDKFSQLSPLTFDASLRDILVPLCAGGTLCLPSDEIRTDYGRLLDWLANMRVTVVHCVPSVLRLLIREMRTHRKTYNLSTLRLMATSGEPLFVKDIQDWRQVAGEHTSFVNFYGPTETTMIKTFFRVGSLPQNPGQAFPVGKPIKNTLVNVINNGQECSNGEVGEVFILTPFTSKGYWKNPQATDAVFVSNPLGGGDKVYRTGDLGRFLPSGDLEILGRIDHQVKVNGVRIELDEVEKAVRNIEGVNESLVTVVKNDIGNVELVLYYTGKKVIADDMRTALSTSLNAASIPSYFLYLDKFPLTVNGKVDRKALPRPEDAMHQPTTSEAALTSLEKTLEEIFREVTGCRHLGRATSFFDLGGNSLRAIQVISRIHKQFAVFLTITEIFSNPTIGALAKIVQAKKVSHVFESIKPAAEQEVYPLSQAQKRLWIGDQLVHNQHAYNIISGYKLNGTLDVNIFGRAFLEIMERNEAMRTAFDFIGESPVQRIIPSADINFSVDFFDFRRTKDPEASINKVIAETCIFQFDLRKPPLFKVFLCQESMTSYTCIFCIHHIISDSWSINIILDEFVMLYNELRSGGKTTVRALPIQYKDFAVWQNKQISTDFMLNQKTFWLTQLEGQLPLLEVPTDFPRPFIKTFAGAQLQKFLPADVSKRIFMLCQQYDVPLFTILLALVNTLLYRYSGKKDIIIGIPHSGRYHYSLERLIGLFVNVLPIRTKFDPTASFYSLLQQVKSVALNAYENHTYPFNFIVDDLGVVADPGRNDLFDVMVQIQDTDLIVTGERSLKDVTIEELFIPSPSSKFDLTFDFRKRGDGLLLTLEYSTDLFREETALEMSKTFALIGAMVSEDPQLPLTEIKKRCQGAETAHEQFHLRGFTV